MEQRNGRNPQSAFSFENNQTKHGPYFRGEGFTFLSDEIVRREITANLSIAQLHLFLVFTQKVWEKRDCLIHLSRSLTQKLSKLSRTSVERHLISLQEEGFIRLEATNKSRGNQWFCEPVLLWSSKSHLLKNIERSRLVQPPKQNVIELVPKPGDLSAEELEAYIKEAERVGSGYLTSMLRKFQQAKIENTNSTFP